MFFYLAKTFWFFASPPMLVLLLCAIAAALLYTRWMKWGRRLLVATLLVFVVLMQGPVSALLVRPLEDRFPRPPADMPAPTGIIVLGGGMNDETSRARGTLELSRAGTRMTAAVELALRYPQARLVFTGGSAQMQTATGTEADAAKAFFTAMGVDPARMTFENRSRNTHENAVFTKEILQPKVGETWLLVTSASHMPRSIGIFRKADFAVTPYPTDYTSRGTAQDYTRFGEPLGSLEQSERALREYMGLVAYRLSGRTDALFPAP